MRRISVLLWITVLSLLAPLAFSLNSTPKLSPFSSNSPVTPGQVEPDNFLHFKRGNFDPLGNTLNDQVNQASSKEALLSLSPFSYQLVQFDGPIAPSVSRTLAGLGYQVIAYIPDNAYLVRSSRQRPSSLAGLKQLRWSGRLPSYFKVDPAIETIDLAASSQPLILAITSFPGEDGNTIADKLSRTYPAAGILPVRQVNDVSRFTVLLPPALARGFAAEASALEGVEAIELLTPERPENDIAVRVVQSGAVGNDAPLFRNGLTGRGQVIGIADTGLDTDHGQFRYSPDPSSQTNAFAVTTLALVNGALPVRITNPNNKVIAYYLIGTGQTKDLAAAVNGGITLDPDDKADTYYRNAVAYDDGIFHGTHVASVAAGRDFIANGTGSLPGMPTRTSGDGVAPDAKLVIQDVGHPSGDFLPSIIGYTFIHQQAYDSGVRVHNNSYGGAAGSPYDGRSAEVDELMWRLRDYLIVFSAGNTGPFRGTLTKDNKNAILVASTDSPLTGGSIENISSFSSHGPTADGRIKPDLAAPGRVQAATEASGILSSYGGLTSSTALDAAVNPVSPNNNHSLSQLSGTSFSSAVVSGAGALVRQYFTDGYYPQGKPDASSGFDPSNALVKAVLLNSSRNMSGRYTADSSPFAESASLPSMGQGWGRLALDDALYFAGDRRELKVLADIMNGELSADASRPAPYRAIQTGDVQEFTLAQVSSVEPLRITLCWADPKASTLSAVALVNDLDLEVEDPLGRVFRGNAGFQNGSTEWSPGAAPDRRNPVEAVYLSNPVPGGYKVRVIGRNVPGNGQTQVLSQPGGILIDSNRQGYALIATGSFHPPVTTTSVTLNGASFKVGAAAPGSIVSCFGYGLPAGTSINQPALSVPLPRTLSGISMFVNGMASPLLYAGAGSVFGGNGAFQINFQIPYEVQTGMAYVELTYNGLPVSGEWINLLPAAPGIFTLTSDGNGQGAILNQDSTQNSSQRPEVKGRVVQMFGTGAGAELLDSLTGTKTNPGTGNSAPGDASRLYVSATRPEVFMGGLPAQLEFAGLAPGYVGLWQINARIPAGLSQTGNVPVLVRINGTDGNVVTLSLN